MPVFWGLDLKEIHWSKFKGSYMFTPVYHLRRTKMIVYQLAMILCVCSEAVGTAALAGKPHSLSLTNYPKPAQRLTGILVCVLDYLDQQSEIQGQHPGVKVHNNAFIGAASYNIFAGVSVAFIFGGAFFFDLFWPERHEDRGIRWAWKLCAVFESLLMLGSTLTMTVWQTTKCWCFGDVLMLGCRLSQPGTAHKSQGRMLCLPGDSGRSP